MYLWLFSPPSFHVPRGARFLSSLCYPILFHPLHSPSISSIILSWNPCKRLAKIYPNTPSEHSDPKRLLLTQATSCRTDPESPQSQTDVLRVITSEPRKKFYESSPLPAHLFKTNNIMFGCFALAVYLTSVNKMYHL